MSDQTTTVAELLKEIRKFVDDREWGQYHTIKNLCMNLSVESAELMEIFTWCTSEQEMHELEQHKDDVADEIADVLFTLLLICAKTNIDLSTAVKNKLVKNAQKYPVEICKGKKDKWTTYQNLKKGNHE